MPSDRDFIRIADLAQTVRGSTGEAYGDWLAARGSGKKAQAKVALDRFLIEALSWSSERQRVFITWLDTVRDGFDDPDAVAPYLLMTQLILPTLKAWVSAGPNASEAHLLLGKFHRWDLDATRPIDHFRRALKCNSDGIAAKRCTIGALCDMVARNQHHLPSTYLGDRNRDVARMVEAVALAAALPDKTEADQWTEYATLLRDRALN